MRVNADVSYCGGTNVDEGKWSCERKSDWVDIDKGYSGYNVHRKVCVGCWQVLL